MTFSVGTMPALTSTGGHYQHHGGGGTLLAWTALAPSALSKRRSTRSTATATVLNALFVDADAAMMHDASSTTATSMPTMSLASSAASSSSNPINMADWNPTQRGDIAHWLMEAASSSDKAINININDNMFDTTAEPSSQSSNFLSGSSTILSSSYRTPSNGEVAQLQKAFALFYGTDRDVPAAYDLLSECIGVWENTEQGGDEIAGLYRVRGDVDMELFKPKDAESDYGRAIQYLEGDDGYKADPEELPAARLGRARAIRSLGSAATPSQGLQASKDYEIYFKSISPLDDIEGTKTGSGEKTSFSEATIDGVQRNPYAAWEWGMVSRVAQNYDQAAEIHGLASKAFQEISDKPRSVICALDRGLDMAAGLDAGDSKDNTNKLADAIKTLESAIESDVNVGGRDVELLQRLVAKEGESRLALAGILWNSKEKGTSSTAESQYGTACSRLDELNSDYRAREEDRIKKGRLPPMKPKGAQLGFSIDDIAGAEEASCSRFKNDKFIEEKLVWNEGLQTKVKKFLTLSR